MIKKFPNTEQHDASDCAAAVLSTILTSYKQSLSIMKIREIIGTDSFGTSVNGLVDGLKKLNFNVKAIRTELAGFTSEVTLPAILHINTNEGLSHFNVLHKISKKGIYYIADPAKSGIQKMKYDELAKLFSGVAILMVPTSEFEILKYKDKNMFELFKALIVPQKRVLMTIILTSLLLSVFGILSSLFSKVIMDEIIPYQLKNSLYVFLFVFGLASIIQSLLSFFRQQILLFLSRKIDIPLLMGYYDHILHLPYFFFGTRRVGDIITRFQDAMTIKDIFTSVSISLVMDILLALISSFFLWNINSSLFMILVIMVVINIGLVYLFKQPYKKINYEQMESGAMLNSQLIESIQNIETIKSMGDEQQQIDRLESRFVNALEIGFKEGNLSNIQGLVSGVVSSLGNLLFMGAGALFIIDQKMSVGDLLVFQTLSQYFIEPVQNIVSLQMSFQEAQIAMKRLSEVMSLDREDENKGLVTNIDLSGDIVFENITFAYGSRPPVIKKSFTNYYIWK